MAGDSKDVARGHLADAGVEELPNDWDVVTLGDLFTQDRGIAVGVMYPGDHVPNGVPLIKAGDLNGSIINPHPDFRISKEKHHEYRRTALEGGELLMTLVGNVGQCAVVPPRMAGWNAARAVAVMRFADSSETQFVQQCLLSRPLQHLMDVWCNTTVQATLNLKEIRQLPLPWPPKQSRDAIAAFGKALDDKIELNRRMNATLETMARALFQSWFVDFDPVRAKLDGRLPLGLDLATAALFPNEFEDSEIGPIPKGWEVKTVGDVGEVICGKTPPTAVSNYYGDDIPFITIPDLHGNVFAAATARKLSHAGANSQANKTLPAGSLCVSCIATPGLVIITSENSQTNQQINSVVPHQKEETYFWYWVMVGLGSEIASSGSGGSVLVNLSKGRFETLHVVEPPHALIRAYHVTVRPVFEAILANTLQSRTLASLRDALLPKLLSGKLKMSNNPV
jgi:type I restriction enzyme S subunit